MQLFIVSYFPLFHLPLHKYIQLSSWDKGRYTFMKEGGLVQIIFNDLFPNVVVYCINIYAEHHMYYVTTSSCTLCTVSSSTCTLCTVPASTCTLCTVPASMCTAGTATVAGLRTLQRPRTLYQTWSATSSLTATASSLTAEGRTSRLRTSARSSTRTITRHLTQVMYKI